MSHLGTRSLTWGLGWEGRVIAWSWERKKEPFSRKVVPGWLRATSQTNPLTSRCGRSGGSKPERESDKQSGPGSNRLLETPHKCLIYFSCIILYIWIPLATNKPIAICCSMNLHVNTWHISLLSSQASLVVDRVIWSRFCPALHLYYANVIIRDVYRGRICSVLLPVVHRAVLIMQRGVEKEFSLAAY